ncbi:protein of unknown function [Cyanobium sp. NIES-981]|nr:protein of unknown function [Cyanobium sp. NIES-981]
MVDIRMISHYYLKLVAEHLHNIVCQPVHALNLMPVFADNCRTTIYVLPVFIFREVHLRRLINEEEPRYGAISICKPSVKSEVSD